MNSAIWTAIDRPCPAIHAPILTSRSRRVMRTTASSPPAAPRCSKLAMHVPFPARPSSTSGAQSRPDVHSSGGTPHSEVRWTAEIDVELPLQVTTANVASGRVSSCRPARPGGHGSALLRRPRCGRAASEAIPFVWKHPPLPQSASTWNARLSVAAMASPWSLSTMSVVL